ncbi:MAG: DNA adenine methylase [Firmicutes bacterium]|nr:DNA adenine methylase [Bacillota bacterium]
MAGSLPPADLRPVYIHNRKFIGSKQNLLDFIGGVISARAPEARTAADLFAGSGVVADYLAQRGLRVVAADHLFCNYVPVRAFLATPPGAVDPERLGRLLRELNALPGRQGYAWTHYGGTYFTHENAARIDAIRDQIAHWQETGAIGEAEAMLLLTSLLYAADKVANTCGQYDAYLKHLGREPYAPDGTHLVDASAYRPLELGWPMYRPDGDRHRVYLADANQLVREVEVDLLYLDPPYNTRQYVDNYHVLENLARWEKPPLRGKTRKFDRTGLKSPYSSRTRAAAALADLVRAARCRHILLSYSSDGIIPPAEIVAILATRGPVEVFEHPYRIFGNGAGRSRRRPVVERIFYCRVQD